MANSSDLAEWVAGNQVQDNMSQKPPDPPKPGEYIVCQLCGRIMRPEDFSKIKKIRKYEFKWHIHWRCQEAMFNQLDATDDTRNVTINRSMDECEKEAAIQTRRQMAGQIGS